ncbi:hypothetical protein Tco_0103071 [Tanacetum coccineum]
MLGNLTVLPREDAAYLQTQLLIAQKLTKLTVYDSTDQARYTTNDNCYGSVKQEGEQGVEQHLLRPEGQQPSSNTKNDMVPSASKSLSKLCYGASDLGCSKHKPGTYSFSSISLEVYGTVRFGNDMFCKFGSGGFKVPFRRNTCLFRTPRRSGFVKRKRHNKSLYHHQISMNGRSATPLPQLEQHFYHVMGSRLSQEMIREVLGKLGANGILAFSLGYSAESCAITGFIDRRTKKIIGDMNVTFDELSLWLY